MYKALQASACITFANVHWENHVGKPRVSETEDCPQVCMGGRNIDRWAMTLTVYHKFLKCVIHVYCIISKKTYQFNI